MSLQRSCLLMREKIAEGTMAFHVRKPIGFAFKPGQAIDLVIDVPELAENAKRHTFSIVSAPHEIDLTVATRMRDSAYKRALANLHEGAAVDIDGPFGSMTLHKDVSRPACFIAGGIGITPFMSMLRNASKLHGAQRLLLIYSNRRPEDAAFLAELEEMARLNDHFQLVATMTDADESATEWSGERRRIGEPLLTSALAEFPSAIHYVVGPPAMVAAVREALIAADIDEDDLRSEEFFGY
ncbi:MAG: FAD-dependent oxidoreductase [Dokdonella sp.]